MSNYIINRIVIYGIGGVGGFYGGLMLDAGYRVTFIVRETTQEIIRDKGLRIESPQHDLRFQEIEAESDTSKVGPVDLIIITVKMHQINSILQNLKPLIGPATIVLPIQNGVEAHTMVQRYLGGNHVIGGVTRQLSSKLAPGHIRSMMPTAYIGIGELNGGSTTRLEKIKDVFESSGMSCTIHDDIIKEIWTKMIFGGPLHGILAVTRSALGDVLDIDHTRNLLKGAVGEVVELARTHGLGFSDNHVVGVMTGYGKLPQETTTSMQRDIMSGQPSEFEFITGAVVRLGNENGVSIPIHQYLYACLLPQHLKSQQ